MKHLLVTATALAFLATMLPANLAVALHPNLEYVAVESGAGGILIVARGRLEEVSAALELGETPVLARAPGRALEGGRVRHP